MNPDLWTVPESWTLSRIDRVATVNARIGWKALTASEYKPEGYAFLATPNIKSKKIDFKNVNYISEFRYNESPDLKLRVGDVLLAKDGNTLGICNIVRDVPRPATVNGSIAVVRAFGVGPSFLRYVIDSSLVQDHIESVKDGMGVPHLFQKDIKRIPVPLPSVEEQRRIADFLDAEVARIDQTVVVRRRQVGLLAERFSQIVDGVVGGVPEVLAKIGYEGDSSQWKIGKISRLCDIIPGYAFPSSEFLDGSGGVRLLRGVNVGIGSVRWEDAVSWDLEHNPVDRRFILRVGDLVMGMDRPWISGGMRIALLQSKDVPSLLLQRVACIRPYVKSSVDYIRWVLTSTHFKRTVEDEMTGVSVPHISADQIGGFYVNVPPIEDQSILAEKVSLMQSETDQLLESMGRQIELLEERKRALITAAVTGQIDVTTARGADVS